MKKPKSYWARVVESTAHKKVTDAELEADAGLGVGRLSDIAVWLDNEPGVKRFVDLLDKIDQTKDPMLLLPLLNVPETVRPYFKDLFERLRFASRSKRQPKYERTVQQLRLLEAVKWVKDRPREETVEAALARVAATDGLDLGALREAYHGKHRSLRQAGRR